MESSGRFLSLTEIGREFGMTSHELGKVLTHCGYRENGRPTRKAFDEQLAVLMGLYDDKYPLFAWDKELVGDFLLAIGRKKKVVSEGVLKTLVSNPAIIL